MTANADLAHYLLNHQTTAVVLLNELLQIRFLNSAAEAMLSVSGSRAIGQPLHQVIEDFRPAVQELGDALLSDQPYTKREALLKPSHGSSITVNYTVTPIIGDDDSHLLLEFFTMDRWLRISQEENLLWQQQTSKILTRGFAHEIKNPLGGIRGAAQLLAMELNNRDVSDPSLDEYTDIIIGEVDRLSQLVDHMMGPNQPQPFSPVNIHEVLERVRQLLLSESQGNIDIERDYDPSIPEFEGNKEQLIQALLNIGLNAQQALTEANTEQAKIVLRSRTERQITIGNQRHRVVCRVDISDNGPGITPALRDTIFYPMVSSKANGTGLGLTIAQHIVNQHHGLIEQHSSPGHTCFTIYIPLPTEGESP
ncbi:Nitrogen regulation protein NR(II) [gamma proteobacterium IMCC2047]|nr:Nitrogen regulation protein NR(II) [gamma proteobacterium IMCC2047]